ncbi:MAG: bifunctional 5,10-methylenetetrahydrofolate dehydrogenase/5,10-methenyltetrahydrofolate cyclohydrolase [bacterium]|nr:bifunctional 5,10-methylenetetrahydrofolate dehydrogenase/5,10-methenyltetrahydrofolate cyclohydrolase [bacterium]
MILLDGKTLSQKILSELKNQIRSSGKKINLDIILVGNDESSIKYVSLKQQRASEVGIDGQLHHLPIDIPESKLIDLIETLNANASVTGYFIQLPLPKNIHKNFVLNSINPQKDADGLVLNSPVIPAVVRGIIQLLDEYKLNFVNKNVVIINDSQLIGQPLKKHFENRHAIVTLCNQSTQNLSEVTKTADLLISATGVKNIVTADMVLENAVVIDVSNGDVDFENVSPKCSYITPTFGGVGPMTVASLLQNTFDLATSNK